MNGSEIVLEEKEKLNVPIVRIHPASLETRPALVLPCGSLTSVHSTESLQTASSVQCTTSRLGRTSLSGCAEEAGGRGRTDEHRRRPAVNEHSRHSALPLIWQQFWIGKAGRTQPRRRLLQGPLTDGVTFVVLELVDAQAQTSRQCCTLVSVRTLNQQSIPYWNIPTIHRPVQDSSPRRTAVCTARPQG